MSGRWALPPLSLGDMAPEFAAVSRTNPAFHFSTVAGRHVLLAFMPRDPAARDAAIAAVEPLMPRFEGRFLAAFFVAREAESHEVAGIQVVAQQRSPELILRTRALQDCRDRVEDMTAGDGSALAALETQLHD
ncbi:MAG: hypothetical protein JHD15_24440, partial [Phenylobacterium sp.]|nr:hypothetical protein [Phenylobacterium sp.]